MSKTAVEWLINEIYRMDRKVSITDLIEQAIEMERNEKLKHQLFIGKVTEIIGFDKAVELLKECNEVFKSEQQ